MCSNTVITSTAAAVVLLMYLHAYHLAPAQPLRPLRLVNGPATAAAGLRDGAFGELQHKLAERRARSSQLNEPWQQDFAFAVVTGSMTAQRRVPLQQITMFTHSIRNYILIGAGADPGYSGDQRVHDVATATLAHLEAFHAQLQAQRQHNRSSEHVSSSGATDSHPPAAVPDGATASQAAAQQGAAADGADTPAAAPLADTAAQAVPEQPAGRRLMGRMPMAQRLQHRLAHVRPPQRRSWLRRRLAWVTGDAAAGQRMNRFKGVPGMAALHRAFPRAKWYIMIDDDTYFFMHNFRDYIAKFDPDEELYTGNAMFYGKGQNDHTGEKFDDGPFAHGGAGVIVSRAAMQKFMAMYDECVERTLESNYGVYTDTQIALCMKLAGVKYNGTAFPYNKLLMVDPPAIVTQDKAERQFPAQHPCGRPHSVHHLQMEHMQALYEAESRAPRLRPTYADIWHTMRDNFVTEVAEHSMRVPDVWLVAKDIQVAAAGAADTCEALCEANDACVGWTFTAANEHLCHFKGRWEGAAPVSESAAKGVTVSGAMLHRFNCSAAAAAAAATAAAT